MKRFKKVLALVLAGVMALALLTACGEISDPDKIMPEDGTPEVMQALEQTASAKGYSQPGDYSVKYSAVTKQLLENLILFKTGKMTQSEYQAAYAKVVSGLNGVKIVGGLTDSATWPDLNSGNPAKKRTSSVKYDSLFTSQYDLSDKVGIGFVTTDDAITTYQLVCLFDEN